MEEEVQIHSATFLLHPWCLPLAQECTTPTFKENSLKLNGELAATDEYNLVIKNQFDHQNILIQKLFGTMFRNKVTHTFLYWQIPPNKLKQVK